MEHTIGIDFGTTKTLVSYYDPGSQTSGYVRLGRGVDKMPTSVFVDEDGVWQFGDDADDFMSQYPSRWQRDFKLGLGKNAPCLVPKVKGKRQQYTAKDLVAKFLQNIKKQCEETVFHEPVTSCIVTYPVAFSIAQREELKEAARDAGFEDVQLLPEPEAAGYAYYKFGVDKRLSKMMVVDWGGGTVDFAMVAFDGGSVSLVPDSYGGAVDAGGRKFDELLFTHLSRKIEQNVGPRLEDDGDPQLKKQVCNCKEKLSRVAAVKQVMLVGGKGAYRTEVGREEFNGVIAPVVDRVVDQLKGLLAGCVEKPQALLLIGGSSSVPFVRERLEEAIGLKCVVWDKLNEAVAIGAAWYGSQQMCNAESSDKDEVSNADVGLQNRQQRFWKSGEELESYIRDQRTIHEDMWYLFRSLYITVWRLNSVKTSANSLAEQLEKVAGSNDSKSLSLAIRRGLNAIALGEFDDMIKTVADAVTDFMTDAFDWEKSYLDLYPGLKALAGRGKYTSNGADSYRNEIMSEFQQLRSSFNDICRKYSQLCEGFTRYDQIVAGNSLLKNVLMGGAYGCLALISLGVGVAVAAAWEGWRGMSNKDFVRNYTSAIHDFLSTCDDFTARGQELIRRMMMARQDAWNGEFDQEESYLRGLNAEGVSLVEVERKILEKDRQTLQEELNSPEFHYSFAATVEVLRQDAPISEARIGKIIEKLRGWGVLLCDDGTIDASAVGVLVRVDEEKDAKAAEFWKVVRRGEQCDGFYIGDAIPQNKLVTALHDYASVLQPEDVLCLFDSTFFGGGGDGFIIAPGGMCWKQLGCGPQACTWNDMKAISANDRSANGSTVSINGINVDVPRGHVSKFENMIKSLRTLMTDGAEALEIVDNVNENRSNDGPVKIVKCPNCGATVSTSSQCCWSCDAPIPRSTEC